MIPIDGPVREGIGLLGSPSFEIPRSVQRDAAFDELKRRRRSPRGCRPNRHNGLTLALFLLSCNGALRFHCPVDRLDHPHLVRASWCTPLKRRA